MVRRLIFVFGDQLSRRLAGLRRGKKSEDVIVMAELQSEAAYVRHHKKKIAFVFSAMRHFAQELEDDGWRVDYKEFGETPKIKTITDCIRDAANRHKPDEIIITEPGEWRLLNEVRKLSSTLSVPVDIIEDDRFLCTHDEFNAWAEDRKTLRMEFFYREMRKKTGLLVKDGKPAGGKWNYDAENRKPPLKTLSSPAPVKTKPDKITKTVLALAGKNFPENFGDLEPFWFAVTRKDAERARDHFIKEALPEFGDYQDAMLSGEKFLYHSILSLYINIGFLDPLETCEHAVRAYDKGDAPLNAVEGFIRQIIGWREFVRGIYWREGEDYTKRNALNADLPLPEFYWTGETKMACMKAAITQTSEDAYAHHIQRLMVTGLFALTAGVDPHAVHEWYLAVYADAYEWVEAPNVIGMSQFADGGVVASKPYAASGAYINRMSDYCANCSYKVTKKTEEDACPFNALYWDFLARNEKILSNNARLSRVYATWNRMDKGKKIAFRNRAGAIRKAISAGKSI